jgi:hypothetical protein
MPSSIGSLMIFPGFVLGVSLYTQGVQGADNPGSAHMTAMTDTPETIRTASAGLSVANDFFRFARRTDRHRHILRRKTPRDGSARVANVAPYCTIST